MYVFHEVYYPFVSEKYLIDIIAKNGKASLEIILKIILGSKNGFSQEVHSHLKNN